MSTAYCTDPLCPFDGGSDHYSQDCATKPPIVALLESEQRPPIRKGAPFTFRYRIPFWWRHWKNAVRSGRAAYSEHWRRVT